MWRLNQIRRRLRSLIKGMVHGITSDSAVMNVRRAIFAIPGKMGMSMSSATGAVQAMDVAIGGTSGAAGTGSGAMSGAAGTGSGGRSGGRMDCATSGGMSGAAGTGSGGKSGGRMDRVTSDGMSEAAGTGSGETSGAGIVENDAMIAARGGFRAMIALRHVLSRKKRSKRDASR